MTPAQFWAQRLELAPPAWFAEADQLIAVAQRRRRRARFNTGSISRTAAVALRALAVWLRPKTVIEVGTFIGVSTLTLANEAEHVYTCDISNDCLPRRDGITCFPYQSATQMCRHLAQGALIKADLWFVDGLLRDEDFALVLKLSTPATVYVFDDFAGGLKGTRNVTRLAPHLPDYVLMPPAGPIAADTTLAALVPRGKL